MPKIVECRTKDALAFFKKKAKVIMRECYLPDVYDRMPIGYTSPPEGLIEKEYEKILADADVWIESEVQPVKVTSSVGWDSKNGVLTNNGFSFWIYKNRIYSESCLSNFTDEEKRLLIMEELDKERRFFEKLRTRFSRSTTQENRREKVPPEVRIFVWQRDGGRCVECGSNENLEYDHIIPFSKGGSNTERNLQLLCANCNRQKSDRIQ